MQGSQTVLEAQLLLPIFWHQLLSNLKALFQLKILEILLMYILLHSPQLALKLPNVLP